MIADLVNFLIRILIIIFLAVAVISVFHVSFYAMTIAKDFVCSH